MNGGGGIIRGLMAVIDMSGQDLLLTAQGNRLIFVNRRMEVPV